MKIIMAATKTCNHRPILEEQLQDAGLQYEVMYFENHPELMEAHHLKTSPILIMDNKVVSVGLPGYMKIRELKTEIKNRNKNGH